jgi:hypothetical protein
MRPRIKIQILALYSQLEPCPLPSLKLLRGCPTMSEPSFSLEQLSTVVRDLSTTVNEQGITIARLQTQNGLSFPVISQIYKSHLVKAASCLIFWSLRHRFRHYVAPETITLLDALVEVLMDRWRYS